MTVTAARRKELDAMRYHRSKVCDCGVPLEKHRLCAACGIAVGPGHEDVMLEPYGDYKVCFGCFRHLLRRTWRVKIPAKGHGEIEVEDVDDETLMRTLVPIGC